MLRINQVILIGTDGIWEMRNDQGEMFGKDRLKKIMPDNSSATAKEMLAVINDTFGNFEAAHNLRTTSLWLLSRLSSQAFFELESSAYHYKNT